MQRQQLAPLFRRVRAFTETLTEPLAPEDFVVQTMPDASPTKWHLAHTSWFFETFVLGPANVGYEVFDPRYGALFNSYYNAVGTPFPRPRRGLLSRPTTAEVFAYRAHVDAAMQRFFDSASDATFAASAFAIELGLHHEEQHQELLLTDLKTVLCDNPLEPAYRSDWPEAPSHAPFASTWAAHAGGLVQVGTEGGEFAFDNERPRHQVFLEPFEIGSRLVTCGEYAAFIDDGGYERPDLWLSDGWDEKQRQGWEAPLYWRTRDGARALMTLGGLRPLDPHEPVAHVSFYEADAYARWAGARLPSEQEWETVASGAPQQGNFIERGALHPQRAEEPSEGHLAQLFGDVWEWTASPYLAYPGYAPFDGAFGEYNGKFMCNQMVLRGGSAFTSSRHLRRTYRNFFGPSVRFQLSGIRLARAASVAAKTPHA